MVAMTSSPPPQRTRKRPAERRAEIIDAATQLALTEGLECITLRRIADMLQIRPGTIGHYFPVAEDLVAETFGTVAEAELSSLLPLNEDDTPKQQLARFLSLALSAKFHDVNRLWLNARHLARYRPTLRSRVIVQGDHWRDRLAKLIQSGVDAGDFDTAQPETVALKILVAVDGLSADLNADPKLPLEVLLMATDVAEKELDLPHGSLRDPAVQ
ncbi:TetR family transcriptional regulator C-terminal domain-containing protein [Nocardioidaceae bacterium SCSIO 66511]|nr:TetR family transcriptional regulator C-terminal domain-containing protein [Nocardioidaceae bacterium SCSIO 66511]